MSRRAFLGLGALAGIGSLVGSIGIPNLFLQTAEAGANNSLRRRAASKGLFYGSAGGLGTLTKDKDYAASFAQECGILAPEGALKWKALRPTLESFNFIPGDDLAAFAKKYDMLFRGHTLVWHDALPAWFQGTVNSQNAETILRNHVKTVVGHYAGRMHSWDVVNEAIAPWEHMADGMRNTPWLKLLGPNYINIAFQAAAEADPKALLVYNGNHLEYDSKGCEACRTHTLNLLDRLKSSGAPVQALGIQAHLDSNDGKFDSKIFRTFLRDVANRNLKIIITELDVYDQNLPLDIDARDKMVADKYAEFLSVALDEPAVVGVLTWGLSDKYSWLQQYKPRKDNAPVRPLPLDENFHRKLAWQAIARAFDSAPVR